MVKTKVIQNDLPLDFEEDQFKRHPSPIIVDVQMCVSYDELGVPIVEFKQVNYKELTASNGAAEDWDLNAMLKAGISPNGSIHTAVAGSRIENYSALGDFTQAADNILNAEEVKEDNN